MISKPLVLSLLALLFYSIANVIIEEKFSKFNSLTLMSVYMVPILLVSVFGWAIARTPDPSFAFPVGWALFFLIAVGFVYAAADYFYISAYTNGGDLATITCTIAMVPVVASVLKFMRTQSMPNMYHVSGFVLAFIAVLLVSKGSTIK